MDNQLQVNQNAEQTYHIIRRSIVSAQHRLSAAVNSAMVITYWEIGEEIYKACGENDRAGYGKRLLEYLSAQLTAEFGKGFSVQGLRNMRQFYCTFPIRSTLWSELSWSHYRLLMRIQDEKARTFYAEECAKSAWSVRQLERQIQPDTHVYEGELEQALIDHLQNFLLELGRGFSFVARQKKFTLDGQNFFIDLVFYNYILKCFVLFFEMNSFNILWISDLSCSESFSMFLSLSCLF